MIALNRRSAQFVYSAIQGLYWLTYGLMISFASVYLQGRGFANREIGWILGASYALSACLQPVLARRLTGAVVIERGISAFYAIIAGLALALLLVPMPRAFLLLVVVGVFALESALQPEVDTLAQRWTQMGCPVDFGKSRGIASLLYSGMTAGMGMLLHRINPIVLPAFYLGTLLLSIGLLGCLKVPASVQGPVKSGREKPGREFAALPDRRFPVFLAGISCLSFGHVVVDIFMLQIMQSFGGDSRNLGIAVSIASMVEVPAMFLHSRMMRRFGVSRLLLLSGWAWFAKNVLIFLAQAPSAIYGAEVLQFLSYGLYIPTIVGYIAEVFPAGERLRGQAMAGSAYTVGSVIATLVGGVLLDYSGVHVTLMVVLLVSLLGAVLFTASVKRKI